MQNSFAKPSPTSASSNAASLPSFLVDRVGSVLALLAVAVWMGGLLALGALAAPVVFSVVSLPTSADAMTIVFRRFDAVAMGSAAVVLATEAVRAALTPAIRRLDRGRAFVSFCAAVVAVFEGICISPRIAQMHALGVVRGSGSAGVGLSRLHEVAEACGQTQVVLLAAVVFLHVMTLTSPTLSSSRTRTQ